MRFLPLLLFIILFGSCTKPQLSKLTHKYNSWDTLTLFPKFTKGQKSINPDRIKTIVTLPQNRGSFAFNSTTIKTYDKTLGSEVPIKIKVCGYFGNESICDSIEIKSSLKWIEIEDQSDFSYYLKPKINLIGNIMREWNGIPEIIIKDFPYTSEIDINVDSYSFKFPLTRKPLFRWNTKLKPVTRSDINAQGNFTNAVSTKLIFANTVNITYSSNIKWSNINKIYKNRTSITQNSYDLDNKEYLHGTIKPKSTILIKHFVYGDQLTVATFLEDDQNNSLKLEVLDEDKDFALTESILSSKVIYEPLNNSFVYYRLNNYGNESVPYKLSIHEVDYISILQNAAEKTLIIEGIAWITDSNPNNIGRILDFVDSISSNSSFEEVLSKNIRNEFFRQMSIQLGGSFPVNVLAVASPELYSNIYRYKNW